MGVSDETEPVPQLTMDFPAKTITVKDASETEAVVSQLAVIPGLIVSTTPVTTVSPKEKDLECGSKSGTKRELALDFDSSEDSGEEASAKKYPRSFLLRLANDRRRSDEASRPPEGFIVLGFNLFDNLYTTLRRLGRSGFGVVFHCRHRVDGLEYAVKAIPCTMSDIGNTLRECYILARINHPNVVRYYNSWVQMGIPQNISVEFSNHTHTVFIAMEYCPSTLANDMVNRKEDYSCEFKKKIFDGLIQGLAQLEVMKIVHRDLSPDNIFFDEKWNPKIGDFGLAMYLDHRITGIVGKDLYSPKEGEEYTTASDMFSFALCMFDMFYAYPMRQKRLEYLKRAKKGILPLEMKYPEPVCRLLRNYVFGILKAQSPDARLKATVMVQQNQ